MVCSFAWGPDSTPFSIDLNYNHKRHNVDPHCSSLIILALHVSPCLNHSFAGLAHGFHHIELTLDGRHVDRTNRRSSHIDASLHSCHLRRQFLGIAFVRTDQHAHVIVHKLQLTRDCDAIFELHIDCAAVLDEASKVDKEEVLRIVKEIQIFRWFGSFLL